MNAEAKAPDRSLDALIAEKVMGWEIIRLEDPDQPTKEATFPLLLEDHNGGWLRVDENGPRMPWSPTSDARAGWEVVEHIRQFWLVTMVDCGSFGWRIQFQSTSTSCGDFEERGMDWKLAFCKGAVRAVALRARSEENE